MSQSFCKHCHMDIAIRNPSGFCDHLYYPDNCGVCQKANPTETMKLQSELEALGKENELLHTERNKCLEYNHNLLNKSSELHSQINALAEQVIKLQQDNNEWKAKYHVLVEQNGVLRMELEALNKLRKQP